MLKTYFHGLLRLIYPPSCLSCKTKITQPQVLCEQCISLIKKNTPPFCKICGIRTSEEKPICKVCRRNQSHLKQAWSICEYEGVIKKCIHLFKYNRKLKLKNIFSRLTQEFILDYHLPLEEIDVIVPIPLHKSRLKEREFNQSEIIAKEIAQEFGIDLETNLIKRIRNTPPQVNLTRLARLKNVQGAFAFNKDYSIDGKNILLIDDVATTGATIQEASSILKENGAGDIYALTIAK